MNNFISFSDFKNFTKNNSNVAQNQPTPYLTLQNNNSSIAPSNVAQNNGADVVDLNTKLDSAKKQNGLIEKLADKIKNLTNIGFGSAKIEQSINDISAGKKNEADVTKEIKNYRRSQENVAQSFGDALSILGAGLVFFASYKQLTKGKSVLQIKKEAFDGLVQKFTKNFPQISEKSPFGKIANILKDDQKREKIYNTLTNKKTVNILSAIPAMFTGGFIKENVLKLNRIGTSQYKPEYDKEKMSKDEIKQIKKSNKKAKRNANLRNNITGSVNGLAMPLIGALGPAGVPLYLGVNLLSKYFIGSREDKGEKSPTAFIENVSTAKFTNLLAAGLVAVPLIKKGQFTKVLEQNAQKVVDELKTVKLSKEFVQPNSFDELQNLLFSNPKISSIMNGELDDVEKISMLSKENIFALKFKQISNDGSALTTALREKCPKTWSLDDAQAEINKAFGANKYTLKQSVGSGTVAQTFVAQDENGKNVCIKLIHKGISKEKIVKDKEAFIEMINASSKTPKEKEYLIKNVENLSKGIEAEVDLQNEMISAQKLAKTVKKADVVKPIEVKNNIYVMERAEGISLSDFNEFGSKISSARWSKEYYSKQDFNDPALGKYYKSCFDDATKELDKLVAEFKAKIGLDIEFEDLTKEETLKMLRQYQDILTEQFSKVDAQGKIIHGDIHPGNIFIDVKKLKEGKNCFTLIDTGNIIEQTKEQSIRFMNLTSYIKNADVDNIVNFVLDGASLPDNMSREKAVELLGGELRKAFFDKKTKIPVLTNDSLLQLTDNIMKKYNIIPSSTQGNLLKAKKSSNNSLLELYKSYLNKFAEKFDNVDANSVPQRLAAVAKIMAELTKDITALKTRNSIQNMVQERSNLLKLPLTERIKLKRSPNAPKPNSEDALTYFIKQYTSEGLNIADMFDGLKDL